MTMDDSRHDTGAHPGESAGYGTVPGSDTEALRRQIEQTRADLSRNVNALGEAASPGTVARRQAEKVGDTVTGAGRRLKETIMGSDDEPSSVGGTDGPGVGERVGDAAGTARDAVAQAPDAARRQARGNPLAAGLIALGAGWLLGSLLPASEKERELAVTAKEQAQEKGRPLVDEVKGAAQESVENLKEPAQEAAEQVKQSAQEGAENVKAQGQRGTEEVKGSAQESTDSLQQHQQG